MLAILVVIGNYCVSLWRASCENSLISVWSEYSQSPTRVGIDTRAIECEGIFAPNTGRSRTHHVIGLLDYSPLEFWSGIAWVSGYDG